ncbi:MAG: hypothetical protein IJG84_02545 [Kiritimatiellae bacterium]|nr:hypothetical protein [Kiritimatiellia bacterium]
MCIDERRIVRLMLCIGLLQIAAYYLAGALVRSDGGFAIGQPDTLLYCQAARRIVEGHAFSFSAGTAVSTGTTSVLYPFVLAGLYAVGFTGDALIRAGFFLNALFYLVFLCGWGLVLRRLFSGRPVAHATAAALVALFGPAAYCAMAQSDIGLWMAVSAFIAYGLAADRKLVYVPLLLVAPWIRPEGMILVVAYCVCLTLHVLRVRRVGREAFFAATFVLSVLGVFAFNFWLTGAAQFSSVAYKGHLTGYPLVQGLYATAVDGMNFLLPILFGVPKDAPRMFFFVPIVGAAMMWTGVAVRNWRSDFSWRAGVWYLAMAGGFFTVATSGWQDMNLDRYAMWMMPAILLLMAVGAEAVSLRLPAGGLRTLPSAVLVGYGAVASVVFVCAYHFSAARADRPRNFAAECERTLPVGKSVGLWSKCGLAYEMSDRRVAHLMGIYSPEFFTRSQVSALETLKGDSSTRFDYWIYNGTEDGTLMAGAAEKLMGPVVMPGPDGLDLRESDWSAFDAGAAIPSCSKTNAALVAFVDVADERSEKAAGYEVFTRYDMPEFAPQPFVAQLAGKTAFDGGRMVLGGDAMTVHLEGGRDVHVVMRTVSSCRAHYGRDLKTGRFDYTFKSPMSLHVSLDGSKPFAVDFPIADKGFSDVEFVIPGRLVGGGDTRIAFFGEHVACGYWFYQ